MTIRPAHPGDFPAMAGLLAENGLMLDGVDYSTFSPVCLVAERDGEVVGFVQALLGRPYAVLTECAVARAHHRKGYGVRLVQHLETLLREYGVTAWATYAGDVRDDVTSLLLHGGARSTGTGHAFVRSL